MPLLPQPLFVLHDDAGVRARMQRAVPTRMHLVEVPDWATLRTAVSTAPPGAVAVIDPTHGRDDGKVALELSHLPRAYPRLRVLALTHPDPARYADMLTLGAWGVADFIIHGTDDRRAVLRERIRAHRADYFARVLAAILSPGLSPRGRSLVASALDVASGRGGAEEWAEVRGVSPRTLLRNCRMAGLPPPRRLLAWMRVLLAADLLESPGHSVATVAAACGYAADMPLRRAIRLLTGMEAPMLIEAGNGLATAAARFVAELEVLRGARGER